MIKEFREFIARGNVIDLAVGIIIGAAFTAIVSSLVADIITPLLGIVLGQIDFSGIVLQVGSATVRIGVFIQSIITFLITAFVVFLLVRTINNMNKKPEVPAAPAAPTTEEKLVTALERLNAHLDKRQ